MIILDFRTFFCLSPLPLPSDGEPSYKYQKCPTYIIIIVVQDDSTVRKIIDVIVGL